GTRAPDTGGSAPIRARWRRRAPVLVSAAAVVAVAVGAAVWFGPGPGGGRVPMADTTVEPSESVAPYWEERTVYLYQSKGFPERSVDRATTWYSRDAVWTRPEGGPVRLEGGESRGPDFQVNGVAIPWDEFGKLPTDPKALKEKFGYKGPAGNDMFEGSYFFGVTEVLARSPAPSRLRAAFGELLSTAPGVRKIGTVKDSAGRAGTGFDYISGNQRFRIILDRHTHRALERSETLVKDAAPDDRFWAGLKAGAPLTRTTYLASRPLWKRPPELPPEPSRFSGSGQPTGAPTKR
ncbi:hypothetical protein JNW98_34925, partial [Streptomyces sp. SCA2-4]|nr:hypothetical protein [Streptomyces huiliensis]